MSGDEHSWSAIDRQWMQLALEIATRGEGHVEPNPMVGCVVARADTLIAKGWHEAYGGPHAEVHALERAGAAARDATLYVTLEPCCHQGKTPPCTEAVLAAGVRRVVIATLDPFPKVQGRGAQRLRDAGVVVEVGLLEAEARSLTAPFRVRVLEQRPWIIAKWAMTLDGRIASRTGHSQWISNAASRAETHRLRGRVDAILVGRGTAEADDPRLTARPAGPRTALRVVLDSRCRLRSDSRLCQTRNEAPVLVLAGPEADPADVQRLQTLGCEVLVSAATSPTDRFRDLLRDLHQREVTNLLVEGGAGVLGVLRDAGWIDEVRAFIAPKLAGGEGALSVIHGIGSETIDGALQFQTMSVRELEGDAYFVARNAVHA